jgi:predicted phosphoadenosine phosphosulfate sulfurtransferase
MMRMKELAVDVVTASRQRIRNIFGNNLPVYLSFSGGKDSLAIGHVVEQMALSGEIDAKRLRVVFIDEEAIFPCVEKIVLEWRDRFHALGATFTWFCCEVAHYNCLNLLEKDESFVCWDRYKKDVWVRQPPAFAVRSHSVLPPREEWANRDTRKTYQEFLGRIADGIHMTGLRAAESIQRRFTLGMLPPSGMSATQHTIAPLYDWTDKDVWRYLGAHRIRIPEAYLYLYQVGMPKHNLRISQFFSVDTVPQLSKVAEFYPGLMERILLREPSAYLVSMYWDSEMFKRRSTQRRRTEQQHPETVAEDGSQRKRLMELISNPPPSLIRNREALLNYQRFRSTVLKFGNLLTEPICRECVQALLSGDPKGRSARAIMLRIVKENAVNVIRDRNTPVAVAGDAPDVGFAGIGDPERLQPEYRAAE